MADIVNPDSIRTPYPSTRPQFPFNTAPQSPEESDVRCAIHGDYDRRLKLRDGVELSFDVLRPAGTAGQKFPALLAWSPYTRQLQYTLTPSGQNESGLPEFWVPRGYAQVFVDVRGTNDSGGSWDHWGPMEQADLKETIEFIAQQPWCNGRVGMVGCSYFGMSQLLGAEHHPGGLTAIFPYDAMTDIYRDAYYRGGIPGSWGRFWFQSLQFLNHTGGRVGDLSGFKKHFDTYLSGSEPLDGNYYWERSSGPRLHQVEIPTYFGCDWKFFGLHLRGAFSGWEGIPSTTPKKMLIGPTPEPRRPWGAYHGEALRWYDHYLKDMDTGVWDDAPVNLYIQGENVWRGEQEWPLPNTVWTDLFLDGDSLTENPGAGSERSYTMHPGTPEARRGEPKLVWRTEPMTKPTEITGPMVLRLVASSDQDDTDWFVFVKDEAPDGTTKLLTRGWLKASHRKTDPAKSKPYQPWHTHDVVEPVTPGEAVHYDIEIVPTCNLFASGHRLVVEVSSCDPATDIIYAHEHQPRVVTNTIYGGARGSRLTVPFIPR